MDKKERRLYEFDRFCLDASERILLCDQQEAPLTPKVFETLLLLVERSGHVSDQTRGLNLYNVA